MNVEQTINNLPFHQKTSAHDNPLKGADGKIILLTKNNVAKVYHVRMALEDALLAVAELKNRYSAFQTALPEGTLVHMDFLIAQEAKRAQIVAVMDYIDGKTTAEMTIEELQRPELTEQWTTIRESLGSLYAEAIDCGCTCSKEERPPLLEVSGIWQLAVHGPTHNHPYCVPRSSNIMVDTTGIIRLFDLGPLTLDGGVNFLQEEEQYHNTGDGLEWSEAL